MNFTKSLTFMFCMIGVALGATKPTDQYKDTNPYVKPTFIRGALKPTDQYKDTNSYVKPTLIRGSMKPTDQYKDTSVVKFVK